MIEIQIITGNAFTEILKVQTLKSGKTSCTCSGLKKNTKYFVRIRDENILYVFTLVLRKEDQDEEETKDSWH